ncbi:hypothetical protein Fmac_030236 [Flemingia macrophylla]|uniref:Uncharacterized protein n=1 Tax=Flemingia macrophylla TaxID=520843 RepID=A0ABD1LCL6_9FABA
MAVANVVMGPIERLGRQNPHDGMLALGPISRLPLDGLETMDGSIHLKAMSLLFLALEDHLTLVKPPFSLLDLSLVVHLAPAISTIPLSFRISSVKDTLSSWEPSHGAVSILQKFVSSDVAAFGSSRPLARPQSVVPGNGAIRSQLLGQPLDMPKPKRIRNLLKSVGQTCQHESSCSDTLMGNHSLPNESPQPDLTPNAPVYTPQCFTQATSSQIPNQQQVVRPSISNQQHIQQDSAQQQTTHGETSQQQSTQDTETSRHKVGRHSNHFWFVDAIDDHGVTQKLKVKVKDVHNLPCGLHIVVDYDERFQAIGEASGLLTGVCGQLATNHLLFPISFESWSDMPDTYKDNVWVTALKVNEDMAKRDVMFKIAKQWREYRIKLWNEFYDPLLSRNDLIKNVPEGLSMDQWALFVDYRLKPSTMELCNRNREIRKRQTIPHTGGAMALSRRMDNLKIETGRTIGRGEMWKITHKRKNGSYVNDEAMEIGEKIDEILSQNPENISEISSNDAIGVIFSKEHPGRGINVGSSSANTSNMEEKMVNMATELVTVKSQVQTLLSYIALKEGGNIPEEMAALFHTSMHQAADVGSGTRTGTKSISPTNMRKSSGGSNVDLEPSQSI